MKKILSTMLVGALLAGAAFADMSFTYTGSAILGGTSKAIDSADRNDCFNLAFSNEIAGAVLDFDITDDTNLALDSYYGWLTFALPAGSLQITSGKWTARNVNRVNGDAGDLDAYQNYFEMFKPGVINGVIARDIDNLTGWVSSEADGTVKVEKNMATVLAYTLNDTLPGSLMVKFGLVDATGKAYGNDVTSYNDSDSEYIIKSSFVGEVCYAQEDVIKLNLAVKSPIKDVYGFGLFVSPLGIENLDLTAGFSMGTSNQEDADYTEMGFDLRARYALSDKFALTTMHNYSSVDNDGTETKAMWNMLGASYVAGENIRFIASISNIVNNFDAKVGTDCQFDITPACEIKASEKATVTAGFNMRWLDKKPYAGTGDVSLPITVTFAL